MIAYIIMMLVIWVGLPLLWYRIWTGRWGFGGITRKS